MKLHALRISLLVITLTEAAKRCQSDTTELLTLSQRSAPTQVRLAFS